MKLLYNAIIIALILCALSYTLYRFCKNKEHFTFVSIPNTHISPVTDTRTDFVFYPKGLKGAVPVGYNGDYLDEMYVLRKTTEPERLEKSIIGQSEIPHNKCNQQTFYEF